MLFDAMQGERRIVEVYDKVITYELEGGDAFRVTDRGKIPVAYDVALNEIAGWRERDGRYYSYTMDDIKRRSWWWLAAIAFLLAAVAFYLLTTTL